ncbi:hypothetical protein UlMin_024519 [Ulmus minor]
MQSRFAGGGGLQDFYTGGRSLAAMNNPSQPQLPGLYVDPATSRISRQMPTTFIGKRTLAEFQSQQQFIPNQNLSQASYFRSVKPRNYQQSSPISPLSPEFSTTTTTYSENSSASSLVSSQRYGLPILQQLRPQTISPAMPNISYMNLVQNRAPGVDSDKKMMDDRLQELEKQLLDDNDGEENDDVSVITNSNSEWSETIQNLISPNQSQKPGAVAPSPTSSSSSSSSVASPAYTTWSKQSIMEAASAISDGKPETAGEILTRLPQVSNPRPNSEQKVLEFMASSLKTRVNPVDNPPSVAELFSPIHAGSTQLLYDLSPCFVYAFSAANRAIMEATLENQSTTKNKVHVIDFDIGQGSQYASLILDLCARQSRSPITLTITTVASDSSSGQERLSLVGDKLKQLAVQYGVSFELNVISQKIGDLSRESLNCDSDEPLAVNFAFKLYRMPDESVSTDNPRDELLRRVKGLSPRVVVMLEQELNTNTAPFMARVNETCAYYTTLLDSINSKDNSDRVRVEELVGRKLANSVACEGRDRVERCEVFGKWRARMGMAGFELKPLSHNVKTLLSSSNRVPPGFSVKEENGGLCFGWMGRTLTVASTWR